MTLNLYWSVSLEVSFGQSGTQSLTPCVSVLSQTLKEASAVRG